MGREKKKFTSGAATNFITRASAVKKLQLSLVDFRRLCILKGIYPVQPNNPTKANKGKKAPRTFYRSKDILFLAHEPIIHKFRAHKIFARKIKTARKKREWGRLDRLVDNKPVYNLDHVVKERYPTFVDALRDLDDPLTMCATFAAMKKNAKLESRLIPLCSRLMMEFMHFIIASRSLRKVFLSIKGIYYQAEIQGQTITWIVPYSFNYSRPRDIDLRIMSTFVEFYSTLLGFINFKLYASINLHYPPKLSLMEKSRSASQLENESSFCMDKEEEEERVAAMTHDLAKVSKEPIAEEDEEENLQDEELMAGGSLESEAIREARAEQDKEAKFKKLFEGCKFFLSREVPREMLTFLIRCFGGQVSWDKTLFIGATYDASDESITHQIVDRPQQRKEYLSRYYVQPQWVVDSVNARLLLPVEEYFPGVVLPPHLSPFVEEKEGDYIPPEKRTLLDRQMGINTGRTTEEDEEEMDGSEDEEDEGEDASEDEEESHLAEVEEKHLSQLERKQDRKEQKEDKQHKAADSSKLSVEAGQVQSINPVYEAEKEARMERSLQEMMMTKKRKRLYQKLMKKRKMKQKQVRKLTSRREQYEQEQAAKGPKAKTTTTKKQKSAGK
ncbi:pescadillo homolog [Acanthaster planci]|uniref:Pescadillo homolog n=1 Tax=Acanthaster planci TaxID=133434 RepID=A0A8B7ZVB9_ACAPL|nr:pescadillo homolog [Acanthaster planci]XP_022109504.1 pescadillo homolog [Acanthaster planci]